MQPVPYASPSSPSMPSYKGPLGAVGRYELILELAAGGMGSVFVGRQTGAAGFEKIVAIKRLHSHWVRDPDMRQAFREEARIASLIRHPNVVSVLDVYEQGDEQLIVMEYVEGVTLSNVLGTLRRRGDAVPPAIALRIAVDALRGLHAAHETRAMDGRMLEVVHRDVSPQNILLGARGTVAITDFGIAKAQERMVRTATGELKGKIRYMAPEQARGMAVDRRTDVFAFGIVLWEMLTGQRAYRGESDMEALQLAAQGAIPGLREARPTLSPALEAILRMALAPNPAQRFPSAGAFLASLEAYGMAHRELASNEEVARFVEACAGQDLRAQAEKLRAALAQAAARSGSHSQPGGLVAMGQPAPEARTLTTAVSVMGPGTESKGKWLLPLFLGALAMLAIGGWFGVWVAMKRERASEASAIPASAPAAAATTQAQTTTVTPMSAAPSDTPASAAPTIAPTAAPSATASASAKPRPTSRPPVLLPPPP